MFVKVFETIILAWSLFFYVTSFSQASLSSIRTFRVVGHNMLGDITALHDLYNNRGQ